MQDIGAEIDKLYLEKCQEVNKLKAQVARLRRLCPPCRIGQDAWYFRTYNGQDVIRQSIISELYFREDMTLIAVVKNVGRGIVGKDVFLSKEAAEQAKEKK